MEENFIQLEKDNIVRYEIKNRLGEKTGKYLEFDLEDIELASRINECEIKHRKNILNLREQFVIIDKKQDKKGQGFITWKQEEKIKAIQKYYKDEMGALDLFIGEGKTQMILDIMGRKPYYSMYDDISKALNPIMPKLKISVDNIEKEIQKKYSNSKEKDVLE